MAEPVRPAQRPGESGALTLQAPCAGNLLVVVGPSDTAGAVAVGLQTLLPGAQLPLHWHSGWDRTLFIHKGQGRAMVGGQSVTVVPGVVLRVPPATWLALRNTGTGMLQALWVTSPVGFEAFFQALSRLGRAVERPELEALGRQFGIEFGEAEAAAAPVAAVAHRRHRRRRGGRGRHGAAKPGGATPPSAPRPPELPPAASQAEAGATPSVPQARGPEGARPGRRRRRRHGPPALKHQAPGGGNAPRQSQVQPARAPRDAQPPAPSGPAKEVYMGGRWVRVSGEGPVIAPGRERFRRRGRRGPKGGGSAGGPLSVSL